MPLSHLSASRHAQLAKADGGVDHSERTPKLLRFVDVVVEEQNRTSAVGTSRRKSVNNTTIKKPFKMMGTIKHKDVTTNNKTKKQTHKNIKQSYANKSIPSLSSLFARCNSTNKSANSFARSNLPTTNASKKRALNLSSLKSFSAVRPENRVNTRCEKQGVKNEKRKTTRYDVSVSYSAKHNWNRVLTFKSGLFQQELELVKGIAGSSAEIRKQNLFLGRRRRIQRRIFLLGFLHSKEKLE
jgi:hypothetical protein